MSAARVVSVTRGQLLQPVAGGTRPQIFLSRTTSRVESKAADVTEDLLIHVGYSLLHCEALKTLFFRSDFN